jgi:alkylhydroperoxidase family enzyme
VRGDSGAAPDARSQRLLSFALKLTRAPHTIEASDVRALRDSGLGDGGIHDAAAVTAYFNFVNRMALGLGVELETPGGGPMTGTVNDPTGNPPSGS